MKFSTLQTVVTAGVNDMMAENPAFAEFVRRSLQRHCESDWGDLSEEDKMANDYALTMDERVFSVYVFKDKSIWIITEADRSTTTVLFSVKY